ncbi:MAG: nucleoside triphosphate pyrophosphohydrolase, partial [Alphaproteobacteria bacterium]
MSSRPKNHPAPGAPPVEALREIMRRLRDPETGCPWDIEQDFGTIAPYTIEEAYEVADAIAEGDMAGLKGELGDLLLQVVYHAQMAAEAGHFTFDDVAEAIGAKMVRRHPHVFGEADVRSAEEQTKAWEDLKAQERAEAGERKSVLADVPRALPALKRAAKLQKRAARVGFDWPDKSHVFDKIAEELEELKDAVRADT